MDDNYDQLLDNLIKGASNQDLMKMQSLPSVNRAPASVAPVNTNDPREGMKSILQQYQTTAPTQNVPLPTVQQAPQTDLMSQAILSLAPALFGAVGGRAAAESQGVAGQQARQTYNAGLKGEQDRIAAQNANAQNIYQNKVAQQNKDTQNNLEALKNQGQIYKDIGDQDVKTENNKNLVGVRREIAAGNAQTRAAAADEKKTKTIKDEFSKFSEDLDPNKARSGNFGDLQKRKNGFDRLEALAIDPNGAVKNLTPQQMSELAAGLDAAITSNPSISGREHVTPESKSKWIADKVQWLTDSPKGADQQDFVRNMMDTVDREKQITTKQMLDAVAPRVQKHGGLKSVDPDKFNDTLVAAHLDPDMFDDKGRVIKDYKPPQKNAIPQKISVSNGKETFLIDPSDLEHAKADGYKEVQ